MRTCVLKFLNNEGGATALEYATIAALVSVVIVGSSRSIGTKLSTLYFASLFSGFN